MAARPLTRPPRAARLAFSLVAGGLLAGAAVVGGQAFIAHERSAPPGATATSGTVVVEQPVADLRSRRAEISSVSRDAARPSIRSLKLRALQSQVGAVGRHRGAAEVVTEQLVAANTDPREIARAMLGQYGWSEYEFSCLDSLWVGESDWNPYATNPTSGAYGIPQSLPAEKMASAGPDWRTNPMTQIEWGLDYIRLSYGTPCSANAFKLANGWY